MDFKQIQSLIRDFEKSSLTNLELELEGFKIKLSKNNLSKVHEEIKVEEKPVNYEKPKGFAVKSPLVGTYYAAAGPNEKPFVEVGDKVEIGQTLCIIEAMKIMNEITASVTGVIESINATNGSPVGFDQVLMVIV
ncbi:MAG: acetyl-CoA carboxylase, biotin carboxyl carrier protein [Bacilli bacterium]|nr:acetyl-CoA carboxylase, biotin carboxyl carrier protein [Bacilli bacterium]MDD4078066.1 acetyl-CoA carboxylase, biotin carboxyl carrier protein [Bacilli bacterium]